MTFPFLKHWFIYILYSGHGPRFPPNKSRRADHNDYAEDIPAEMYHVTPRQVQGDRYTIPDVGRAVYMAST